MASGSQTAGFVGGLLVAVGAILTVLFPPLGIAWGATVGPYVLVAGALTQVGVALSARAPSLRRAENSPTYSIDTFRNPRGPDALIPIVYGTGEDAPRVAGVVISEGVMSLGETPRAGVDFVREQGLRMIVAMAEGPVKEIREIQLNDTPIFSDEIVDEFKGNGTKSKFELSNPWPRVQSLVVTVDGTQVFNTRTTVTGTRLTYAPKPTTGSPLDPAYLAQEQASRTASLIAGKREEIIGGSIKVFFNGTEVRRRDGGLDWSARRISRRRFDLEFSFRPKDSDVVTATYDKVTDQSVAFFRNGRGRLLLFFGASRIPANGAKIVATYVRENFPGIEIATTTGTLDQEALPGLEQVLDSQNPDGNRKLEKDTPIEVIAKKESDDLRIGLLAPYGLKHYDDDGSEEPVAVKVSIRYAKRSGSTWGAWKTLRTLGREEEPKTTFTLGGLRTGRVPFEISIRKELEILAAAGDEDALVDLEEFTRGLYRVAVERKTKVRQDSDSTYVDTIDFSYLTTIEDTPYRLPGTALLSIAAPVGVAIGTSTPVVSAVVDRGDIEDPRGGTGSSSNPALAIFDLVTSARGSARQRFGGGEWFTADDLAPLTGAGSIGALADWCDEWINPEDGSDSDEDNGQRRARLSLVIDSPGALLEWVSDIAFMARAFAVLQGVRWRFPIDRDETPVYAFVESRSDVAGSNIRAGSLTQGPDSFTREPTELIVQFWNREIQGKRDEILVHHPSLAPDDVRVTSRVSIIGETRPFAIVLMGRHLLAAARSQSAQFAWTGHPGAVLPEAGDIVTVTSDRLGLEFQTVRLLAVQRSIGESEELPWIRFAARAHNAGLYGSKPGSIAGSYAGSAKSNPSFGAPASGATSVGSSSSIAVGGLSARTKGGG